MLGTKDQCCLALQLFDRETIEAVLQEWYRTVSGLPGGVRRAVEMVRSKLVRLYGQKVVDA